MTKNRQNGGYTLIEIVVVIVIIGILSSLTLKSLRTTGDIARTEETRKELDRLARAIIGQPAINNSGSRSNYGYLGDIGALPPNLEALFQNPGGLATWRGPYIRDDFYSDSTSRNFKKDAWGVNYIYSGGLTLSSTGGGTTLTRQIAPSLDDLLYNKVVVVVTDLNNTPPGTVFKDSVRFVLRCPDGHGSYRFLNRHPDSNGLAAFDSIPIGLHELRLVYQPDKDTLLRRINVDLGSDLYLEMNLFKDVW